MSQLHGTGGWLVCIREVFHNGGPSVSPTAHVWGLGLRCCIIPKTSVLIDAGPAA